MLISKLPSSLRKLCAISFQEYNFVPSHTCCSFASTKASMTQRCRVLCQFLALCDNSYHPSDILLSCDVGALNLVCFIRRSGLERLLTLYVHKLYYHYNSVYFLCWNFVFTLGFVWICFFSVCFINIFEF